MGRAALRILACDALMLALGACHTWQPVQTAPQVLLAPDNPSRPPEITVKTLANARERLGRPSLSGDTLVGTIRGPSATQRRIPLDSVRSIETYRFSGATTATAVIGGALVTGAVYVVLLFTNWPQDRYP